MKRTTLLALIAAMLMTTSSAAQDGSTNAQETKANAMQTYWIFLTTGKSTQGVDQAEIATMQQAHLANFGRLAQAGKLLTAGPMADPDKTLRGIVVLQAENETALKEMFLEDPYVQQGYMNVESHPVELSLGTFTTKLNEQGLDELRIAVLTGKESEEQWIAESDLKALQGWTNVNLILAARFTADGERRGCLIFRSTEDDAIKSALSGLAPFKIKELDFSLMPQYLGKGAIEAAGK